MVASNFQDGIITPFLITPQMTASTGQVYFVGNSTALPPGGVGGKDDSAVGLTPQNPFDSIDFAIGQCVADRGDIIYVMPNFSDTHAAANAGGTAAITLDIEGVSIVGLGEGDNRPKLLANFAVSTIDLIEVTADSCTLKNLIFSASTTAAPEARIDIADTDCLIENCLFECGAFDAETITIPATGNNALIQNNLFIVTADGSDSAIEIQAIVERVGVVNNYFDGMSNTNAFDDGAIDSGSAHTNCLIADNTFANCAGIEFSAAATGLVVGNRGGDPYTVGSCEYIAAASGGSVQIVTPDSGGESTAVGTGERTIYVSSVTGTAGNDGSSPTQATTTLALAVALASVNDTIVLLQDHVETLVAAVDVNVAGVTVVGVGNGVSRPVFTINGTVDGITMTAADVRVSNIVFAESTAVATSHINMGGVNGKVDNCWLFMGASDTNYAITVEDSAGCEICDNKVRVMANGPKGAVIIESADCDITKIRRNLLDGGTTTNGFDNGAVYSTVAPSELVIEDNNIMYSPGIILTSTADGVIKNNSMSEIATNPLDPGSCSCSGNTWSSEALDANAVPVPTYSAYDPVLGYKLSYTDGDVLDTVQNPIFTIAGGRVLVTQLSMEIATANASAGASTLQFLHDATAPTDADYPLCAAGNDIASAKIGSIFSITGVITDAPAGGDPGTGAAMAMSTNGIILSEGAIDVVTGADSGAGGALPVFEIWYKPLDTGATVTAA